MERNTGFLRRWSVAWAAGLTLGLTIGALPAGAAFTGKVCPLLKAGQLASVNIAPTCAQSKTLVTSLGTQWTATWGEATIAGPHLTVSILRASPAYLAAVESDGSTGKPVVGSWWKDEGLSNANTHGAVSFVIDGYFVGITLGTGPKHPLDSEAPFIAVAKVVAKKL